MGFVGKAWVILLFTSFASGASAAPAVLLSFENKVETAPAGTTAWTAARTNQSLATGDRLRTLRRSRALLQLSDLSVLRVNELTLLEIRTSSTGQTGFLDLQSGSIYFFNRERPATIEFRTPVASGAIRGTEFHLAVADNGETTLTVLEGEVSLSNAQGELVFARGEQGIVTPGQAPRRTAVVNAINIIQWCLYYPAVVDPREDMPAISESVAAYRRGNILRALELYPANREPASDAERVYLASLLLAVGQVDEAQELAASSPDLLTLIRIIKGQPTDLPQDPLVQSYYYQSRRELKLALAAARKAAQNAPWFGFAWARVAELEFGFARTDAAAEAIETALEVSPGNAQAWALKGFLLNAKNDETKALESFESTIVLDPALGNGWLGRGLTRFRMGQREAGRADMQVAATLEPQRSLLRSYLGKAFTDLYNEQLASKELRRAGELDPNDPTVALYSALLLQQENRVNEAVDALETSKAQNDNRQLFRSRLLLDQDQAVRSANLASIYRDAGMFDVSAREASRAVMYDYANYSAHLFLANSYDALRDPRRVNLRYETPWFSELLIANLLAPVGGGALSQNISQQEYSRLFAGDRGGVISSSEYYSRGDWIQYLSQYGIVHNSSYAIDGYYRSENGERPNNDLEQFGVSAKFKQQLTPDDGLFVQAIYFNAEAGDVAQYWDWDRTLQTPPGVDRNVPRPDFTLRVRERQDPLLFLGYDHKWAEGIHTLFLGGRLVDNFDLRGSKSYSTFVTSNGVPFIELPSGSAAPVTLHTEFEAYSAELQQIFQVHRHTFIAGARFQDGESDIAALAFTTNQMHTVGQRRVTAYGYYFFQPIDPLQLMAGVSYDYLEYPRNATVPPVTDEELNKDQVSPKAGFYWTPFTNTVIHGAFTRSLGGVHYDTSVRLEPTQIAGFNQAYRSVIPESMAGLIPGSEFTTYGAGIQQKFPTRTYVTVSGEILNSQAERSIGAFELPLFPSFQPQRPMQVGEKIDYEEKSLTVVLNQLLGEYWSIGGAYRLTDAELEEDFDSLPAVFRDIHDRELRATLQQASIFVLFNHSSGFFARADSLWSWQENRGYTPDIPGDDFWQHNIFLGYRFFHRHAEARVGLLNITDENYRLNPLTIYSELPRSRTIYASLRFYF
jgi:FecR-like protein/TonB-dependent receptor-like protein